MKTGWIKYEYWTNGTHGENHYLFIGGDVASMSESEVFEYVLYDQGDWAKFAERFRAEWEVDVIPPKKVIENRIKEIKHTFESSKRQLKLFEDMLAGVYNSSDS